MKYEYVVEMGAGTMIYIPSFIKLGSGIQKLMGGGDTQLHRQQDDFISLFLFFQNKESRLKTVSMSGNEPRSSRP
jgi:hypothetical protein